MNNNVKFTIKGEKVKAKYRKTEIPAYINNPLIESLPPILSNDEATSELSYYPEYHEDMIKSPAHIRHHLIQNNLRFFSPLDIHLDLERRISCSLRVGYTDRNPMDSKTCKDSKKRMSNIYKSRSQYGNRGTHQSTAAVGFGIVGISGVGKSQTIERIIKLYPQIICHSKYKNQNFTQTQLVWLKLDCPFDGSIKGLCYLFFRSIDDLLGTNYYDKYAKTARSTDDMLPNVARVAANHFIGVLVIDEMQRLSKVKSGGGQKMLDFFVQLVNTIGVPTILVGTYKALPILSGSIAQMRRAAGQGDLIWDRMQFDEQWQLLIEGLWDYQYLQNITSLEKNPHLGKVLYEESQGITDLAIKLFGFSQELAITSGKEKITTSIIRSAAKAKFNMLRPALKALKDKDKGALEKFEDAYPKYIQEFIHDGSSSQKVVGELTNEPEIKIILNDKIKDEPSQTKEIKVQPNLENQEAIEDFFQQKTKNTAKEKIRKSSGKKVSKDNLIHIFDSQQNTNSKDIYTALCEQELIRSGSEFISATDTKGGSK